MAVSLIAVFVAVWVAPLDTVVSRTVKDVGVRVILSTYAVFNATTIGVASHDGLLQPKCIPFEDESHTPHPLLILALLIAIGLYISPMSARHVPVPPVTVNPIFISHVGIAPKIGKFVNDSVGIAGFVIEYNVDAISKNAESEIFEPEKSVALQMQFTKVDLDKFVEVKSSEDMFS